jgi:TRAP-type C4-dicarboxylate transport system substrate-binding protein
VRQEFQLTNEAAIDEYAEQGVRVINVWASAAYNMLCNRPVDSESEISGARVRSAGPVWNATLEALGAVPVSMPSAEMFEGLQRGVLDCVLIPRTTFWSMGFRTSQRSLRRCSTHAARVDRGRRVWTSVSRARHFERNLKSGFQRRTHSATPGSDGEY